MSPIWSILNDHLKSGEKRPVYFFYGARTRNDLFYLDRIAELVGNHSDVTFIPVLSHANDDAEWQGERGFVHQSVDAMLKQLAVDGQGDVHACGPPPMIDALQPVLFMNGFETERIFFDKFTTSAGATPAH
jgi:propane monooxygenase reductase subunit